MIILLDDTGMGMTIGSNHTGVSDAYVAPFAFAGTIKKLEIETMPTLSPDEEAAAEIRVVLGTQ